MTGKELKQLLKGKDVNLTELAKKCGLSRQAFDSRCKTQHVKDDFLGLINQNLEEPLKVTNVDSTTTPGAELVNNMVEQVKALYEKLVADKDKQIDELKQEVKIKDQRIAELTDELLNKSKVSEAVAKEKIA